MKELDSFEGWKVPFHENGVETDSVDRERSKLGAAIDEVGIDVVPSDCLGGPVGESEGGELLSDRRGDEVLEGRRVHGWVEEEDVESEGGKMWKIASAKVEFAVPISVDGEGDEGGREADANEAVGSRWV